MHAIITLSGYAENHQFCDSHRFSRANELRIISIRNSVFKSNIYFNCAFCITIYSIYSLTISRNYLNYHLTLDNYYRKYVCVCGVNNAPSNLKCILSKDTIRTPQRTLFHSFFSVRLTSHLFVVTLYGHNHTKTIQR